MGFWRKILRLDSRPSATFDASRPLSSLLRQVIEVSGSTTVTRAEALSVPAVMKARNMVCSIATLPLTQTGPDGQPVANPLLKQFDLDIANVVHIAQTVEDLLFDAIAWWEITSTDFAGFPMTVRRVDPAAVSLNPPGGPQMPAPLPSGVDPRGAVVYLDGRPVPASRMIRFDSPNPGVLAHCGRSIRRAIAYEQAALVYAKDPRPADFFSPADGAAEHDDEDVQAVLDDWASARRRKATGYVPAWLKYNAVDAPTPQELQLAELQKQVWIEISQALGVDAEDLGVSTTSRTYFNAVDRKQSKVNEVLAPFMRAIADTLSLDNVTRRGHRVSFDLTDYLKPDPAGRIAYYEGLMRLGVITAEQIAKAEGLPAPAGDVRTDDAPESVDADRRPTHTFASERLTFVDIPVESFSVNRKERTIEGLAVPYGQSAKGVRFERGALRWTDPGRIKLLRDHDSTQPLGVALSLRETHKGVMAKFRLGNTAAADEALSLAADGILDGLSVGVDFDERTDAVPDPRNRSGLLVRRADWRETSLTAVPAFDDARLTSVNASAMEGTNMSDTDEQQNTAPAEQAPAAVPAPEPVQEAQPATVEMSAEERPRFVNPVRPVAATVVRDPVSYRFDRRGTLLPAAYDFGLDIIEASKAGMAQNLDNPAYRRVMEFMRATFADDPIGAADVNELNPTINLPRYIDERAFTYPLWSRLGRGAPPNGINPFQWPKFSSSGIAIQDFSEGTEPELDDYQTTSQSVTPTAKAAKASIPRTVWDMGGTPGIGNLIFQKMTRAWYEAAEAVIDAALDAVTPTSLGTLTAGNADTGQTLSSEIEAGLAALHFVRGGFRFDFVAAQADLFLALAAAKDDAGRPLYPVLGPQNANGTVAGRFGMINVGGVDFVPSWAAAPAGQTSAASSYLIDSTAVDAWVSPPQRLEFQSQVKTVEIAAWGYMAAAVNDLAGVREISWDPDSGS